MCDLHCVLMDIEMPVMNGLDSTKAIRRFERENSIDPKLIIAITAHSTVDYFSECLDSGISGATKTFS